MSEKHDEFCNCEECKEYRRRLDLERLEWRIEHEDRMYEKNGPRYE